MISVYLEGKDDKSFCKSQNLPVESRFPIQVRVMIEYEEKTYHRKRRTEIILDYATRQRRRTDTEKQTDLEVQTWFQDQWVEARMSGPLRSWERWDGMIEEWEPWNRFGEAVNHWKRYHKK